MFITLKNTSRGQAAAGNMEQVAQKNAGPDANNGKMRTLRRPACISCQKKKLRCSGSSHNCDRCKVQSVDCVFPSTTSSRPKSPRSTTRSSSSSVGQARTSRAQRGAPIGALGQDALDTQPAQSSFTAALPPGEDLLNGDFSQLVPDFDINLATDQAIDVLDLYHDMNTHDAYAGPSSRVAYNQILPVSFPPYSDPLLAARSFAYTSSETMSWQEQTPTYPAQGIIPQSEADYTTQSYQYFGDFTNNGHA